VLVILAENFGFRRGYFLQIVRTDLRFDLKHATMFDSLSLLFPPQTIVAMSLHFSPLTKKADETNTLGTNTLSIRFVGLPCNKPPAKRAAVQLVFRIS
jgi:hypothetical protein